MTQALRTLVLLLSTAVGAAPLAAQGVAAGPPSPPPRGWIGVSFETTTTKEGARLQVVSQVVDVSEGSPAAGAGIRRGDILVSINGRPWEEHFDRGAPPLRPGDVVRLVVERDGRRREVRLVAGTRPPESMERRAFQVTLMPDSVVERLYQAMDSLRVRIVEDAGLRSRVAELQAAADSVMEDLARERIVRLRRGTPGRPTTAPPSAPPGPGGQGGVPSPSPGWPFGLWSFADSLRDSLRVAAERGTPFTWAGGEGRGTVIGFRPTVPYFLGENRAAGAEVVELRPELATYFHVDGGILVVDVARGTPAARAGVLPGDVLTHLAGEPLRSIADLRRGLARGGGEIPLALVRKGRTLQLSLSR